MHGDKPQQHYSLGLIISLVSGMIHLWAFSQRDGTVRLFWVFRHHFILPWICLLWPSFSSVVLFCSVSAWRLFCSFPAPTRSAIFSRRFSREKCPTLEVASFFFVRLQSHSDWATFLTIETTKTTSIEAKSGQRKLVQKGPPFHFLLFYRNLQNRTILKGSTFFSALCDFFSKIF